MPTDSCDVRLHHELPEPPAVVWQFLFTPDGSARWLGRPDRRLDIAGPVTLVMIDDGRPVEVKLNIDFVDPPHELDLRWQWPGEPWSRVRLDLRASKTGTILTLRHTGVPTALQEEYRLGWEAHLDRLLGGVRAGAASYQNGNSQ